MCARSTGMKITKGSTIKVNGKRVKVVDVARSKFGQMVWFRQGQETRWVYAHEVLED